MREIKFRGKAKIDGKWWFGNLVPKDTRGRTQINNPEHGGCFDIDPDTVGQYTGLHDKNGKEIYEGDIIRTYGSKGDEIKHTVCYSDKEAMFCTKLIGANMLGGSITQRWLDELEFEVIGNVHDNMELLKGGEE